VDDAEEFAEVRRAMELLSFTKQEMDDIFSICAGVLHCGNIAFVQTGDRASKVGAPKALEDAAHLLQVKKDALEQVCVTRRMQVPGQAPITVGLGAEEAKAARDALSKFIYEKLFDVRARPSDGAARADGYLACETAGLRGELTCFLAPVISFVVLFQWLVERINKSIGNGGAKASKGRSIGILGQQRPSLLRDAACRCHG
jgi:myosin heavy subunit